MTTQMKAIEKLTAFLQCFNREFWISTHSPLQFLPGKKVEHSLGKNFEQTSSDCIDLQVERESTVNFTAIQR